jgi:cytochrome c553
MRIPPLPEIEPRFGPSGSAAGTRLILAIIAAVGLHAGVLPGQDATETRKPSSKNEPSATAATSTAELETAIAGARERAKLLHSVYSTTLDVMHHRYFRRDAPILPARAMEDVFEEMALLSGTMANWISVNTKAMSINHEPRTEFEKKAAAELSSGKESYELVGKGMYRRATAIPLQNSCVGCHTKMFAEAPKTPRFAGLVISIPLKAEKK